MHYIPGRRPMQRPLRSSQSKKTRFDFGLKDGINCSWLLNPSLAWRMLHSHGDLTPVYRIEDGLRTYHFGEMI